MPTNAGRPRRASHELLQEAAFEMFQLRGYNATSVELIAKTAGFSRATFFNFFSSKAELFWVETDIMIAALSEHLDQHLDRGHPPKIDDALRGYTATLNSASIPWALQNFQLIDGTDDLVSSGANRVLDLNGSLHRYMSQREQRLAEQGVAEIAQDPLALRAKAAALTARLLTALLSWINAGVHRGDLAEHLERALPDGG